MTTPTSKDHVVQTAHVWRELDKQYIAAPDEVKQTLKKPVQLAKNKHRNAIDMDARKNGEVKL